MDTSIQIDKQFTISHIGSLLSERNPKILWESLSELVVEEKDFAQDFQLRLVGTVSEQVIKTIEDRWSAQTIWPLKKKWQWEGGGGYFTLQDDIESRRS